MESNSVCVGHSCGRRGGGGGAWWLLRGGGRPTTSTGSCTSKLCSRRSENTRMRATQQHRMMPYSMLLLRVINVVLLFSCKSSAGITAQGAGVAGAGAQQVGLKISFRTFQLVPCKILRGSCPRQEVFPCCTLRPNALRRLINKKLALP